MSKTNYLHNQIIANCKLNKAKAQMQLYDLYCDAMFVIANRYVKNNIEAEDIMQDAFIKVFKDINNFKGEVSIGAWIKKIVINQCIDYLKKKKIELVSIEENNISNLEDDDWGVDTEITIDIVVVIINNLPEKYKVVLNLYLIEGFDHKEISKILNIAEATSRSQLMRGKNKLKTYTYV
ncbi:sigma-70 family RNA polymerase sigma factor [Lutibacter sp. A64]|uniref:RNA polymerase sigma factor n=1 Tax=Lutibacter sp. A64 TaxID=2918526 RepID=UPI001F06D181|nr:sigma-70 family RNA polymerase sigma factor [Lutibacter sp. A64]UMB54885.1 sigma-70 family RNA polymerase sigma factor [Lutibacter sp. A64]